MEEELDAQARHLQPPRPDRYVVCLAFFHRRPPASYTHAHPTYAQPRPGGNAPAGGPRKRAAPAHAATNLAPKRRRTAAREEEEEDDYAQVERELGTARLLGNGGARAHVDMYAACMYPAAAALAVEDSDDDGFGGGHHGNQPYRGGNRGNQASYQPSQSRAPPRQPHRADHSSGVWVMRRCSNM